MNLHALFFYTLVFVRIKTSRLLVGGFYFPFPRVSCLYAKICKLTAALWRLCYCTDTSANGFLTTNKANKHVSKNIDPFLTVQFSAQIKSNQDML